MEGKPNFIRILKCRIRRFGSQEKSFPSQRPDMKKCAKRQENDRFGGGKQAMVVTAVNQAGRSVGCDGHNSP